MPLKKNEDSAPEGEETTPKKGRRAAEVVVDDDEEVETTAIPADREDVVEIGSGAVKVLIRRSVTAKYEDGVLDNWVAEVTVDVPAGVTIDAVQAEVNRGHIAAAYAIGASYSSDNNGNVIVGLPKYNGKTSASSARSTGGAAVRSAPGGAIARRTGGGGGGLANATANYSEEERKALWSRFLDDVEDAGNDFPRDGWYDNTEGKYPNVKPKQSVLSDLGIDVEPKPLYLKTAPKKVQSMFEGGD